MQQTITIVDLELVDYARMAELVETYADFPTITWTADHTNPAVSYIGREVRDNHFTVDT